MTEEDLLAIEERANMAARGPENERLRAENERINSLLRDYEPDNSLLKEAK